MTANGGGWRFCRAAYCRGWGTRFMRTLWFSADRQRGDPKQGVCPMSNRPLLKISSVFCASLLLATVAVSPSAQSAAAESHKRATPVAHRGFRGCVTYHRPQFAHPATLPYGPEFGFLAHVPPNAIRAPGYTFVPGVGILGEFVTCRLARVRTSTVTFSDADQATTSCPSWGFRVPINQPNCPHLSYASRAANTDWDSFPGFVLALVAVLPHAQVKHCE